MRWLILFLLLAVTPAWADDFNPPGLRADSDAYKRTLLSRMPAGGTPIQRRQAEQRAADAQKKGDWAGVADALEARIAAGNADADTWLALARAELRRTPPDPNHAAEAASQAFGMADTGAPEIPALLVMADAFRAMNRPEVAIQALEAVQQRAPDDANYQRLLADARKAAGLLVKQVHTEPEADPAQACIEFTTAPARRAGFVPADWVRLVPAQPAAAVTREGDQICVAGLPLGATTQIVLRAGLPGEDGLALQRETTLAVAMANRAPRLIFDNRVFLLPRNQAPRVNLASVNLAKVKLKLLRLSERNLVPWSRDTPFGTALEEFNFENQTDNGKVVWEGTADLPKWQPNQILRTALPLPDAFTEPGAYMLLATPGDGTPNSGAAAVQVIFRTDLAPTVWRGSDGLTVQMRSYADGGVRPGVKLSLLAHNNDILAEATTDANGVARFPAPLLRGDGPQAPQSIHGSAGDDLVALDLTRAAFDLSDRGVEGQAHPGPLDAFAWTDRGIYRPGETVQVMTLLRNAAGSPEPVAAHVVIKRPNGQVFLDRVPPRGGDASVYLPVPLSTSAPVGEWTVEVLADPARPPIGRTSFRVDAFVPDRLAVDLVTNGPIVPGKPYPVPVTARFLYGAPAANLTGSASLRLEHDPDPLTALAGYHVGLDGEAFAPDNKSIDLPTTDPAGKATLPVLIATAPDSTFPLRAQLDVSVDDPSGRAAHGTATLKVRPATNLIGIKPGFDDSIDAGAEAGFDIAAVNPDGARVPLRARLKLVRERPDWRLVRHDNVASFEIVYKDEPIEAADISIPAGQPYHYAKRLDFGRYRLEVAEAGGLAATSVRFRAGWVASDSPDTPDKVDVSTDRRSYPPGATAHVRILSPFAGHATVLALTDRVHSLQDIDIPADGTTIDVPVDAAWGPGAYITVHVFRAGDGTRPARAIGLAWAGIDPAARTLPLAMQLPDKTAPRARFVVPVTTAPGAWVTLAAVDEGVLRLTNFTSPDPVGHFLGRRRLGLDIRDDWGRLIPPAEGETTLLKQGGDEGGSALAEIPQKVVALFTPPVQAGADGTVQIPLDLPDFNGQVRLMAVAWQGDKVAAAASDLIVRDPMIAEPLLPRFLAPGDEARLAVLMQNVDLPTGDGTARITVEGPLAISGDATLTANLVPGAQVVRTTTLTATGAGRGVIHLAVTGPGGFQVTRDAAIIVRPSRAPVTVATGSELAPGATSHLVPALTGMVAGTGLASASFGGAVRYDVPALLQALADYPMLCLEQASSKGFPLALAPADPDRAARLQASISTVLDKQRFDGGFGLWTAANEAQTWLSAYATEFLLRARAGGASVPDGAVKDALKFLSDAIDSFGTKPEDYATEAYYLYALALGGQPKAGANRVLAESLDKLPTPLAKAQLGAALALSNDRARAETAFNAALAAPDRRDWDVDRGSALRDQLAIALLLKESGLLPDKLGPLLARLPGADLRPDTLNTQEWAWAAAAGEVFGRDGRPTRITVDGTPSTPAPVVQVALAGPVDVRNLGDRAVWQSQSARGVPVDPPPAARNLMRVTRHFYTGTGDTLDLSTLKQNTVFVLLIEGRVDDGQDHRALLDQGLPAGWEIVGRFNEGKVDGMSWLGELSATEAQPAADDRFAATMMLTKEQPGFRIAVRLRAVTPGNFEMPGALLSDMYRPAIFARQGTNRIQVLAPE